MRTLSGKSDQESESANPTDQVLSKLNLPSRDKILKLHRKPSKPLIKTDVVNRTILRLLKAYY